jgi:DNA-binding transcriptional LysR family regulator
MAPAPRLVPLAESERPVHQGPPALSPEDMLIFAAIAREGGIRRGALALRIPRSTVSRHLDELERSLGGRLVVRSTRRFGLTELGRALLDKCDQLQELLRETRAVGEQATSGPWGTLKVAAAPAVGEEVLPDVIDAYLTRYPGVRLTVELSVAYVDLGKGGFDLAIRTGPLAERGELTAVRVASGITGQYASAAYLERRGVPETPDDLAQHDCILMGDPTRPAVWAFRVQGAEVHVPVAGRLRVNNFRIARAAAASGLGIARLPSPYATPLVENGELVPVLERFAPRTELFAVHTAGRSAPPKIRAFIELLRAKLAGDHLRKST